MESVHIIFSTFEKNLNTTFYGFSLVLNSGVNINVYMYEYIYCKDSMNPVFLPNQRKSQIQN